MKTVSTITCIYDNSIKDTYQIIEMSWELKDGNHIQAERLTGKKFGTFQAMYSHIIRFSSMNGFNIPRRKMFEKIWYSINFININSDIPCIKRYSFKGGKL